MHKSHLAILYLSSTFSRCLFCFLSIVLLGCSAQLNAQSIECPPPLTTYTNEGCNYTGWWEENVSGAQAEVIATDTLTPEWGAPIVTSAFDYEVTQDAPVDFPRGVTTTVTWTVTDVNGGVASCTQDIYVVDTIAPGFIEEITDTTLYTNPSTCTINSLFASYLVTDNCDVDVFGSLDGVNFYPVSFGSGSPPFFDQFYGPYEPGEYEVTWLVDDNFDNNATYTQVVTVTDDTGPEAFCEESVNIGALPGTCGATEIPEPSFSDPCGGLVIENDAPDFLPLGTTEVTWTATDIFGNEATCTQDVTVVDDQGPEVTCPDDITVTTPGTSAVVNVPLPVTDDNCAVTSISNNFNNTDNASGEYPLGSTVVQWTVSDASGNQSTCVMVVNVVDEIAPPIDCPDNIDVFADADSCEAFVSIGIPTVVGGEELFSLTNDYNNTSDASDVYPVGVTAVTWTGIDLFGFPTECTMFVTVADNTPASLTCPEEIIQNVDPGLCAADVALAQPVANDACGISAYENNAPSIFQVGTTTVTWTITDVNGNESFCDQDVTVIDNQNPEITCPSDILTNTEEGMSVAIVSISLPNVSDNCGIDNIVNSFTGTNNASGNYPIGETVVTWTVTDIHGNTATCDMTVTVADTEGPEVDCPSFEDVSAPVDDCSADVVVDVPVVQDNDGIASIVNDFNFTDNASGVYPVGTTDVIWTVTDLSGNITECSMSVTIIDDTNPAVECAEDVLTTVLSGSCENDAIVLVEPEATDACGISTITSNAPDVFFVETTTVVWTITDVNGNVSTCEQDVTVEDNVAPEIICPPSVSVTTDPGVTVATVSVGQATATDDCGIASILNDYTGTDNASGVYPLGTSVVTWTATDVNGNSTTCTMTVTVTDGENPTIICPPSPSVVASADLCEAFVDVDVAIAADNDGISSLINDYNFTNDASDVYPVGVTDVVWTATDFNDNTASCTMTVTVLDETPPAVECPDDIVTNVDDGECDVASVNLGDPSAEDACGILSITNNAPNEFLVGNTVVIWTITDNNINVTTCEQTITVIDDAVPTLICPEDVVVQADENSCEAVIDLVEPVAFDPCGIASVLNDAPSAFPVGTTTVIWTITDENDNQSFCEQMVTVEDNVPPEVTCPPSVSATTEEGEFTADVLVGMPIVFDDCGIESVINDYNNSSDASDTYPIGITLVTWIVTDVNGNVTTCSMTVTVIDDTGVPITCPAVDDVNAHPDSCSAFVSIGLPVPDNGETLQSLTNDYNGGPDASDVYPVGVTTVIWTGVDVHGNSSFCSMTVTVWDVTGPELECADPVDAFADPFNCEALSANLIDPSTSDACGIASFSNNASPPFVLGENVIIWTVTDVYGNASTCEAIVNVIDTVSPNIDCPPTLTIEAGPDECEVFDVELIEPDVSDACGEVVITNDAPNPFIVGTTEVTWTATDESENTSTCISEVTVLDVTGPTIECPDDVSVFTDPGVCEATNVDLGAIDANDACGLAGILNDAEEPYHVGITPVTWSIADVYGNVSTCISNVEVIDNEDPIYVEADDLVVDADLGECFASVIPLMDLVVDDNCGIDSLYNDLGTLLPLPVGVTVITWTIIDINGNVVTYEQPITVVDNQDPLITCPADITVENEFRECWAIVESDFPVVSDNCEVDSVYNNFNNTGDASDQYPVGTNNVTWTVVDIHGNEATCVQVITVVDTETPALSCPPNVVAADNDPGLCGANVFVNPALATDNCLLDVLENDYNFTDDASDFYPVGTTIVTWTASDSNGNSDNCTMTVTVFDTEDPVIDCPADILANPAEGECEVDISVPAPVVSDNCAVTYVNDITGTDDASGIYVGGITVVTWTATDASGNQASCVQEINVQDIEAPMLSCPEDISIDNDHGECGAIVDYPEITYSDNCGIDTLIFLSGAEPGTWMPVGDTIVSYTVIDLAGNNTVCSFNLSVIDVEFPIIECPNDTLVVDTSQVVEYPEVLYFDNCEVQLVQIEGLPSGSIFPHCTTWNTFIATDASGNSTECTFSVTLNVPPVAVDDVISPTVIESTIDILPLLNDFDPDGDAFEISDYSVDIGTVSLENDSIFVYEPVSDWCGIAKISYTICNTECVDVFPSCDSAVVYVNVACPEELVIPEGISPDGDGINDTFEILGLWQYPNNKIQVFNRWGHIVFEAEGYDGTWDGMSQDDMTIGSSKLPRGTYYYLLDLGTDADKIKGFVYILTR